MVYYFFIIIRNLNIFLQQTWSILLIDLSWLLDKNFWYQINLCFCLFPMFLNHSVILLMSFHWSTLIKFSRLVFILSNVDLLILPSSFLAGFSKRNMGLLKNFGLWSFKRIKQLFLPFRNIRLTAFLFLLFMFSSALTLLLILSGIFLYVDVIVSVVNLLYSSLSLVYVWCFICKNE